MKLVDLIRGAIDTVDQAEQPSADFEVEIHPVPVDHNDDATLLRMKQIAGLLGTGDTEYQNSPEEKYARIDAVIASGDDVHHSKHPSDMRSDSVSMYPGLGA